MSRTRAFTLLELLAAMALMVATSACLYTSLYTAFRARRSAAAAAEPTVSAAVLLDLLAADLRGAVDPNASLSTAFTGADEEGDTGRAADSLSLATTHISATGAGAQGPVAQVDWALMEDPEADTAEDEARLLIRQVTTHLLSPDLAVPEEQVLCRTVRSLNLRYHDGTDWVDAWDSTSQNNALPQAVEIDVELVYTRQGAGAEPEGRHLIRRLRLPAAGRAEAGAETGVGAGAAGGMQP